MSRLAQCFETLQAQNKKALIPYFVAGDPSIETTLALMHKTVEAGANILEIGVPFSDPMAEGPVIQLAHERALIHHVSLTDTLNLVGQFRENDATTPVVLMGYSNPVEAMGYETFARLAVDKGVDAILLVDMPPEESSALQQLLKTQGVDMIFLIAPTTPEARIQAICEHASGYLYYVSLKGVTGAGHFDIESVKQKLSLIGKYTNLPISVGFGIKDPESASLVAEVADGVVVGSAVVKLIDQGESESSILGLVEAFIGSLRQAVDNV